VSIAVVSVVTTFMVVQPSAVVAECDVVVVVVVIVGL